jgi:hypothetical protein
MSTPRSVARVLTGALLLPAALVACRKKPRPETPEKYTRSVKLRPEGNTPTSALPVMLDGKRVGALSGTKFSVDVGEFTDTEWASVVTSRLLVGPATTCGTAALPLQPDPTTSLAVRVSAASLREVEVYLDNLDGPATKVEIGRLAFDVAAGALGFHRVFVAATCPEGSTVKVGDRSLGALEAAPIDRVIVAVDGKDCYSVVVHKYGRALTADKPQPPPGKRIHPISDIPFVLREVPGTVREEFRKDLDDTPVAASRRQLVRCDNRMPPPSEP